MSTAVRRTTRWRVTCHLIAALGMTALCAVGTAIAADTEKPTTQAESNGPLTVEQALQKFQLSDSRLRIEPVAAEPLVIDPVAAQFDEQGRLWVVEMRDYPHGPGPGEKPKSRIKILEDRDADGQYETVTLFADELLFATELQPWKGGVIVTLGGQVVYLQDRDGDGKVDHREVWYEGFAQENSQLRANHPRLGLDGWIYVSNGLRGGSVRDARAADSPVIPLAGKDFRFHPATGNYEAITGVGQFGLTFDDHGNRFICSNRNPLMHVVLEDRYIRRNPKYAPSAARHDVAKAGEDSRIYAVSRAWTTSNLHAGQFTAACGVLIYRAAGLPSEYYGAGLTCDPTGNLVHAEFVEPAGATFTSHPVAEGKELLASPDEWFRPVNLFHGPDGALYVVDMYRAVIEHPDFMPEELKKRADLMLGIDRGRIWRVTSREAAPAKKIDFRAGTPQERVARLSVPGWVGDTAFRLAYEQPDVALVPAMKQAVQSGTGPGCVRSLWLLEHSQALSAQELQAALRHADPRVREQAVRIAESRLESDPEVRDSLRKLASDEDPRVRFQVTLSLAPADGSAASLEVLRHVAVGGVQDPWVHRAVAIAAGEHASPLAVSLLRVDHWPGQSLPPDSASLLTELIGVAAAQRNVTQLTPILAAICQMNADGATGNIRQQILLSLAESASRNGMGLGKLAATLEEADRARLQQVIDAARVALQEGSNPRAQAAAAQLLGHDESSTPVLQKLVGFSASQSGVPTELRLRVLAALSRQPTFNGWQELVSDWPRESPTFRRGLLDALLSRPERTQLLLDAIEAGEVKPGELETSVSNRLLKHGQREIRVRAEKLLASLVPADRQKVLQEYQPVLAMQADAVRGKAVFAKNCSTCHRVGDLGVNVAPDISDSRVKKPEQLLTDILQPNRAIDNNYLSYTVVTADGLTLTGVIASETGTSITLKQQEGKETTLLRSNIEELRSNGISLMPEGLEKNIPPQEMADLIAFIKNWRYLDGRTPLGN